LFFNIIAISGNQASSMVGEGLDAAAGWTGGEKHGHCPSGGSQGERERSMNRHRGAGEA